MSKKRKTTEIKVLSVQQPHADSIMFGKKWSENRSWRTHFRGEFFIHASRWDTFARENYEALFGQPCEEISPGGCNIGCIIGKVNLVEVIDIEAAKNAKRLIDDVAAEYGLPTDDDALEHVQGPVCWIMTEARPLKEPISCKGQLGVFTRTVVADVLRFGRPRKKSWTRGRRRREEGIRVGSRVNHRRRNYFAVEIDDNLVAVARRRNGSPEQWFDESDLDQGWFAG